MKNSGKKFLTVFIVAFLVILAINLFSILQNRGKTYHTETTPEDVVFNYLLALENNDYPKAWSCLSPGLEEYPQTSKIFAYQVQEKYYIFDVDLFDSKLAIESPETGTTNGQTTVQISQTYYTSWGLFYRDKWTTSFEMVLQIDNDQWKIIHGDNYWLDCWDNEEKNC